MNAKDAADVLWARRRVLFLVLTLVALASFGASFLIAPRYRASAKLVVVQSVESGSLARVGQIAGALGLDVGEAPNPLHLYTEVLLSRDMLADVVDTPLPLEGGGTTNLLDAWGGSSDNVEKRRQSAIEKLRDYMQVRRRDDAGVLEVAVETFDPRASSFLANDFARRLNAFDAELKRWSGKNRSEFLGARRQDILRDLSAAEDSLTSFRMSNRQLTHPRLRQEEMRLLREVAIQTELLQTVRVQEELARLEAKTEGPVLKTIQHAVAPTKRSWPRRGRIVVIAVAIAALALAYVFIAGHELGAQKVNG